MTSITHKSIADIEPSFLRDINPHGNAYFSKPLLASFESSNPKIDMRFICVSDGGNAQALAIVQIVELGVDVILKNIKVSSISRYILNLFFVRNISKLCFAGMFF